MSPEPGADPYADVRLLLEAASLLVPEVDATADDMTVTDVWDHLVRDEWEQALSLLEELGDGRTPSRAAWRALGDAAELLRLARSAAWCRWRAAECRAGTVRADLTLGAGTGARAGAGSGAGTDAGSSAGTGAGAGGGTLRAAPVPGAGVLRPMWDVGGGTLTIAALWVEELEFLEPGGRALVRLLPLSPSLWRHVTPGQRITMHENRTAAGTATVLEVRPPAAEPPASDGSGTVGGESQRGERQGEFDRRT